MAHETKILRMLSATETVATSTTQLARSCGEQCICDGSHTRQDTVVKSIMHVRSAENRLRAHARPHANSPDTNEPQTHLIPVVHFVGGGCASDINSGISSDSGMGG